jgi:hypothetical protein
MLTEEEFELKRAKGIQKAVVNKQIRHKHYKEVSKYFNVSYILFLCFRCMKHVKTCSLPFEDSRAPPTLSPQLLRPRKLSQLQMTSEPGLMETAAEHMDIGEFLTLLPQPQKESVHHNFIRILPLKNMSNINFYDFLND